MLHYIKRIEIESAHDYIVAIIGYTLHSVVITDEILQIWRRHSLAVTNEYNFPVNKKSRIKGYNKTVYSLFCLVSGKKSEVIKQGFYKINHILSVLKDEQNASENLPYLIKITKLLSRQSLFSYINASFICWKLRYEMFHTTEVSLKQRILIFTYVYRWWYDHRFDMS